MKVLDIKKRILHKKNEENEERPMEIVDRMFDGFFQVPNIFIEEYARVLGPLTAMVYMSMRRHAGIKKKSWPSVRLICYELKMSPRSVIRGIMDLEKHGIIKVDRKNREHNTYELLHPKKWRKVKVVGYGVGKVRPANSGELKRMAEVNQ